MSWSVSICQPCDSLATCLSPMVTAGIGTGPQWIQRIDESIMSHYSI